MFNKQARLNRTQFDHFFKIGKRVHTPELTLIYAPHEQTHAAVVVGKKVARKAHDRNLLRRRVYGALYRTLQNTKETGVYILLTKPSFKALTKKEQIEKVQNLLNRISIRS